MKGGPKLNLGDCGGEKYDDCSTKLLLQQASFRASRCGDGVAHLVVVVVGSVGGGEAAEQEPSEEHGQLRDFRGDHDHHRWS